MSVDLKSIDELFQKADLRLPLKATNNAEVIKTIFKALDAYKLFVNDNRSYGLLDDNEITECVQLIDTITQTLFKELTEGFWEATNFLLNERSFESLIKKFPIKEYDKNTTFYRLREVNNYTTLEKKDLFHIPFEQRNKVSSQRFSITGAPCLYLGTSIYICWEELGRPKFDNIQVCKFVNRKKINLLNLSFSQYNSIAKKEHTLKVLKSLLISYPLIASCSIFNPERTNDPFKPEYIFPQILLHVILKKHNVDGLIYSSTRVNKYDNINDGFFENVVLPTVQTSLSGYCNNLKKLFEMSEVVAGWHSDLYYDKLANSNKDNHTLIIDGLQIDYKKSRFALLEAQLQKLNAEPIDF